jgi:DNA-binding transcriptional LysR family regulator
MRGLFVRNQRQQSFQPAAVATDNTAFSEDRQRRKVSITLCRSRLQAEDRDAGRRYFSLINLVTNGVGYALLPGRIAGFSALIRLTPLSEKYSPRQTVTLLMPKNRERNPNLLVLATESRMFGRGTIEMLSLARTIRAVRTGIGLGLCRMTEREGA